jgi:uncharacterized protein YjbJ (UPF0337 family)
MEGEWKQRRGRAMHHWGKVMNDDLAAIAGKYEEFVGRLQERYGIAKEEANQQVKDFKETIGRLKKSNSHLMQLRKTLHNKNRANRKRAGSRNPLGKTTRTRSTGSS